VTIFNTEHPEGVVLDETYLPDDLATEGEKTVKISDTEYFVMGDNRPNSYDSRRFGSVDRSFIVGRAWLRGWPVSRAGVITTPTTNVAATE
jgi:signal peptidase I